MNEKLIPNPEDRIMCVKVGKVKRENLYEMPRKYWKVDITRARKVTHVLAIVNGIVEEVYNPVDWKYTEDPKHIGRCEFLGIEDEHTTYIGKDVSAFYGKSQNPVKYINMLIMENPVFNEIKNWHLFTEKFGEEYLMHDASIKRFDLNGDELTIVLNTVYEVEDGKVYDVTFRFSNLIRLKTVLEIGNDYAWGIDVKKDKYFKNLFQFTIESAYSIIECFNIELVSITEAEPFERGMICLDDPNVAPNNSKHLWRT